MAMGGMVGSLFRRRSLMANYCRVGDLQLSNLHPKKAFIIASLDKEIRLSFAKRIRSTLPEDMHSLIPKRLDDDTSPEFKYENPRTYNYCRLIYCI